MVEHIILQFLFYLLCSGYVNSVNVVGISGFDIELKCSKFSQQILWFKGDAGLSEITTIYEKVRPIEFRDRLSITGNHTNGEYHLTIATVKKTDVGIYSCTDIGDPEETSMNLIVVDGPSNVTLDKTQNKLVGTEDEDFTIICTALSDDPSPDMIIQIKNQNFTWSGTKTIQHTIQRVDRSYDGSTVTCLVGYQRYNYFNVKDSATIYLKLIPSTPTFSPDRVLGENTKPLVIICTSNGGRPEATERQWKINNLNVTSYSDISSSHISGSDTYTVTSKLTYSVTRHDNGKTLSCGFKNDAVGNYISSSRMLNIRYAPSVTVENKIFSINNSPRQLTCVADGNPSEYTYSKWQHKSKYGTVIRYLEGNNTLTLPPLSEETRYQDSGEYVCTVSNGIVGANGDVSQKASGYVISQGPPDFLKRDIQTVIGQSNKDVDLVVDVYSEPKYTSVTWLKSTTPITSSVKYNMTEVPAVLTDIFHGTEVQVDGYQITLTIHRLEERDFVNYTLRLWNGVGQTVEHLVILLSARQPDIPTKLAVICTKESAITLQWSPAFNGGHTQAFIIEYRMEGTFDWIKTTVPSHGLDDELQIYSLSGLKDGTPYEVRMYAENKFNRSGITEVVRASTIGSCKSSVLTGVAVGLSTITLTSLIINGVFIYRWHNLKRKQQRNTTTASRKSQSATENYYNLTDEVECVASNRQNYEVLGTKEKPNVYDTVRQPETGGEEKMTLTGEKLQKQDDKSNVYEELDQSTDAKNKVYSNTMI